MSDESNMPAGGISGRKEDHIDLTVRGDVAFRQKTTLLECVELIHDALPELNVDDIDTSVQIFGKTLKLPLVVSAMTGGTDRAGRINSQLAGLVEELGLGMGLGSQRPILRNRDSAASYQLRKEAPTALIFGNIGGVQAAESGPAGIEELAQIASVDAMCIHLNPAMEVVQPEGDRDFRGVLKNLGESVKGLSVPVIAKETGCGLGPATIKKLHSVGVEHVDVSGAGGTSWVAVETHRAQGQRAQLGQQLWDWGVPTGASVLCAAPYMKTIIATGGIKSAYDAARALALGATCAGIARPILQVLENDGVAGVREWLSQFDRELRAIMLLVGAKNLDELRKAPRLIRGDLQQWLNLSRA